MSYSSSLQQIVWILVAILGQGTLITAAILLMRGRGAGPWLILSGSVIGLGGSVANQLLVILAVSNFSSMVKFMAPVSALATLGWLTTCAGVLILAFQHRALVTRNQELESILRNQSEIR